MKLDAAIKRWVKDVEQRFDVSPDQSVLLTEAAALRQRIADCERAIESDGLMIPLRGGGTKIHPAVRIQQDCRGLLIRYLKEMGLHEAEEDNNGIH